MQPRFGIRSKLLLSILAILLVSYSTLLYSTMKTLSTSLRTEIDRNLEANLRFARSQYSDRSDIVKYSLLQSSVSKSVQKRVAAADREWLGKRIARWHAVLPFLDLMVVLDADKRLLASLSGPADGRELAFPGAVEQALAGRRVVVSTEIVSGGILRRSGVTKYSGSKAENGEALVVTVVVPIIGADGTLLGCIVTGEILNRQRDLPSSFREVFGSDVELGITQRGLRIAGSRGQNQYGSEKLSPRVIDILERGEIFRGEIGIGAGSYETAIDPLLNSRGEVVGSISVAVPVERFQKLRRQNLVNICTSALVGIICSFALAFLASRRLTDPLRSLAKGARKIEEGDLDQRVEESQDDEIGLLAGSFNRMAQALRERDHIITSKTTEQERLNSELELKVAERTCELTVEMGRFEAVLTGLAEGVVVTDHDNRVVLFNPAAQSIFELVPHRVIGQPIARVCELGGLSALSGAIAKLGEPGREAGNQERIAVNGKRLQVRISGLSGQGGSFAGIVLSIRDVTVEEQVDRMKTEFIATVSHELKTPLTSMKGSLQLLLTRGKWLTETEKQLLTVCFRNTERLIRLIGEILDISRIESGGMPFKFQPVSIGELAVYAVEEIGPLAAGRNITVVNSVGEQLTQVYGDSDRLLQVLTNLLSNAVKFSPEGKVVMVTARQDGNYLEVSISDHGKTIQWADREKLFKKFQQIEGAEGTVGGAGLGLAICKEIVERHHGRIFYTAEGEAGNTFSFTVPIIGETDAKG